MSRLLLLSLACLLAACGQKGPLYLPASPVAPVAAPEAVAPGPAAEAVAAPVPAVAEPTEKNAKDKPATAPRP